MKKGTRETNLQSLDAVGLQLRRHAHLQLLRLHGCIGRERREKEKHRGERRERERREERGEKEIVD